MVSGNGPFSFLSGLFGKSAEAAPEPIKDPKTQIRDWIAELKAQLPRIDATLGLMRKELPGREALLQQAQIRVQTLEREIAEALKSGDRTRAGALAVERETHKRNVEHRRQHVEAARATLQQGELKRARYLEAMTEQLRELNALLQESNGTELEGRVRTLAARARATGGASIADKLLKEAEAAVAASAPASGPSADQG